MKDTSKRARTRVALEPSPVPLLVGKKEKCGLSEGSNELRGALGCFLLDTYYVNGEERENKGRELRRRIAPEV